MAARRKTKKQKQALNSLPQTSHLISDNSGSYKEISYDVLERAVARHNSAGGYTNKNFNERAIISSDEMLSAKSFFHRAMHKSTILDTSKVNKLAIIVVVLILIFAALAFGFTHLNNKGMFVSPNNSDPLKEKIVQISTYDKEIIKLNVFLESSINETKIKQANIDKGEYDKIKENLEEISLDINDLKKDMDRQSDDYLNAGYAQQTIESRIMMIDSGLKIYDQALSSISIINATEDLWNDVIAADSALKESDNLVQSNNPDNYVMALQNSQNALNLLNNAKGKINDLSQKTSAYDFKTYLNYIDIRIQSANLSCVACQAMIDQDIEKISTYNAAYIEKSNQASDIALKMSTTPVQVIRTNYDLATRPLIEEFKAARKSAADYDFALRNFLNQ